MLDSFTGREKNIQLYIYLLGALIAKLPTAVRPLGSYWDDIGAEH